MPTQQKVLDLLDKAYAKRGHDIHSSIAQSYLALELSRTLKNSSLIGKSLSKLALYHMVTADNEKAIAMSEEAIHYFSKENDEIGIANSKYCIAGVYYKTNNYHLGMFHLIDCLTIYRKYGDKHNESRTQKTLGTIYEILGDQTNAIVAYEQAIKCAQDIGDLNLESNVYNPLSGILLKQGDVMKALDIITKSVAIKTQTGDRRGYAFAVYGRGKVLTHLNKFNEARADYNEALSIHRDVKDLFGMAMCYNKLAHLFIKSGNHDQAKAFLKKAIVISDENNLSIMKYKCYHFMYIIFKNQGKDTDALLYLEKYIEEKDSAINSQTLKVIENYERISKIQSQENEDKLERERSEIAAKQERAEQTSAMKQNFLSAMSHEIRTPLNAVTSIISLLQERSDREEKKLLTSLQFSAKNLLRIINDILDFSKLDSNKMTLEQRPIRFKEVMEHIRATYISLAHEKGINLNLSLDPEIGDSYELDETKLFQILGNLVSNSIKFTDEGNVEIYVELEDSNEDNDRLTFKVIDTGSGIKDDEKELLFESFYIPQSIMTRNDGGTGLGLAIVKKLVELHGSTIQLESTVDKGSTFYFTLNLKKAIAPNADSIKVAEDLNGKVAILAEDNEINALVMDKLLSKWGVTLERVKNGREAVKLAKAKKVDFILMDIHMPELNGFDATKLIRTEKGINQSTPIFALTADVTSANSHEYSHHFNGFLWKPLEIDRLFETLSTAQHIT